MMTRRVVVCLTGAVDQTSGSNQGFSQLCDGLSPGTEIVRASSGGSSYSSWATFPSTGAGQAVTNATFAALDRNADQQVNAADGPITLTIVGFSWGGVNAGDLATQLGNRASINHTHLRMRLIILDAYQPTSSGVSVAAAVDEAWSFRHRTTPSGDCSAGAPLGPYRGVRLRCAAGRPCSDYDFSAAPTQIFNGYPGSSVGHCEVPTAATPYVRELVLQDAIMTPLPPAVPVTP